MARAREQLAATRADDMVSLVGGDEFACLLADVPSCEQLSHPACKLFDAVGAPMKIGQLKLAVHASIGIAVCPTDGASAEALVKSAATRCTAPSGRTRGMPSARRQLAAKRALPSSALPVFLVRAHRALAESGCSFLVARAPGDELAERVAVVARTMKAVAAQRYGRFISEELVEQAPGEAQVFESPECGLDIDTRAAPRR